MTNKRWLNVFFKSCIGLGTGVVFALIYLLIRMSFTLTEFINAFFLTGFFVFIMGLSSFVTNQGFFDMISYGFSTIPFMFHIQNDRKYEDLIAYKESKVSKREVNNISWLGYVFAGIFYILLALILYAVLKLS